MNGVNGVGNGSVSKVDAERQAQRSYWTEHSVETTLEAMMLDSQAKAIDLEERPEVSVLSLIRSEAFDSPFHLVRRVYLSFEAITVNSLRRSDLAWRLALRIIDNPGPWFVQVLGMLGSVKGKRVMELGAGIGRFTGDLGAQAKSVLALDFMQRLIEENERKHGHMGNITFKAGDACELEAEPESFEVVFTNWLLMYLGKALWM